jgi:hypothetical protein
MEKKIFKKKEKEKKKKNFKKGEVGGGGGWPGHEAGKGIATCSTGSGKDTVASSCEYANKLPDEIKRGDILTTLATLGSSKRSLLHRETY